MAGEFDTIVGNLKLIYPVEAVDAMVNSEAPFREAMSKKIPSGAKAGEGVLKFKAYINPPENQGYLIDGDDLPAPKDRTEDLFTLYPKLVAAGLQIGAVTREVADSNKSSFNGGEFRWRTKETMTNLGKFIEQQYVGTHGTGRRARVESATTNANTFTAALPEGVTLLRENQYISIRTTDGGNTVSGTVDYKKITDVNRTTRLVTFDGDGTHDLTAGDHVHPVTKASQTFTNNPFTNGLRGQVDDATYQSTHLGLSRSTYPKLKSYVNSNGGELRNLTEQILLRSIHEVRDRSGKSVTDAWTGPGQFEKYIEFVAADRRAPVGPGEGTQNMTTGYKRGQLVHMTPYGPVNLNLSFDVIPREIFLLNWETFFLYQAKKLDWWEGDMLKFTPTSGGYKASMLAYVLGIENFGCLYPLANAVIRDLRDPRVGD